MRARLRVGVLSTFVFSIALGATAAESAGNAVSRSAQRAGDELFVQTAPGGTLTPVPSRRGLFRLVLRRPHHDVTVFSDRPQRRAGSESSGTLNSPLVVALTTPAGPGAEIDFTREDAVQVNSPGPISFSLAQGGAGFLISSSKGASAVVELTVTPLRDPIVGTVEGTFNTMVTIQTPSGATFPVVASNRDRFTIPLDAAT